MGWSLRWCCHCLAQLTSPACSRPILPGCSGQPRSLFSGHAAQPLVLLQVIKALSLVSVSPPAGASNPPFSHQPERSFYEANLMTLVCGFQPFRGCSWREIHSSLCHQGPFLVPCQWNDFPLASFMYSPAVQPHRHSFCSHAGGSAFPRCIYSQRSIPWNTTSPYSVWILLIRNPLKWCLPPKVFIVQKSDLPPHLLSLTLLLDGLPNKATIREYA